MYLFRKIFVSLWSKIDNTEQGNLRQKRMTNKESGYVYILTNPSFREDWVKIGKSIEMPLVPTKGTSISHILHFVARFPWRCLETGKTAPVWCRIAFYRE